MRLRCASGLMLCCLLLSGAAFSLAADASAEGWPPDTFAVLCYHDVRDDLRERPDAYTTETGRLSLQFAWLRAQRYHIVSLDEIVAARREHKPLPERAVLLSFDDGLRSVYTRVFPLLKAFHYPAIVGLVGSWMDEPGAGGPAVHYPGDSLTREDFLRPAEIAEMQRSGLVEFASHSYAMHEGIIANPQGNLEPATVSRRYDRTTGLYESDSAYADRIRADLTKNSETILRLSGARPRVIVWPYGAHNRTADRIAAGLGMPFGLTLENGLNTPDVPLDGMRRALITHDFTTADLARLLQETPKPEPLRVVQVDLDYVYDANPAQQEANLSALLDRIKAMGVNTVYLQAYADPQGTGTASAVYFPNRRMPMRADLFNRVAWQLHTRADVGVYAWLPVLAFGLPEADPAHDHWVTAADSARPARVRRLSPFDPHAREAIRDIYADLATHASFQGLLFSDDATLSDFEDAGSAALETYRQWDIPGDVAAIRKDPGLAARWGNRKIRFLTDFSLELAELVRDDHENLRTARNLFAGAAADPDHQQWLGQSLSDSLAAYDYVALMAMPYLEQQRADPDRWLARLVAAVAARPQGLAKTVFELQSVDWSANNRPIDGRTLAAQFSVLRRGGARHLGYYPDEFRDDRPALDEIRPALSLKSFPANE